MPKVLMAVKAAQWGARVRARGLFHSNDPWLREVVDPRFWGIIRHEDIAYVEVEVNTSDDGDGRWGMFLYGHEGRRRPGSYIVEMMMRGRIPESVGYDKHSGHKDFFYADGSFKAEATVYTDSISVTVFCDPGSRAMEERCLDCGSVEVKIEPSGESVWVSGDIWQRGFPRVQYFVKGSMKRFIPERIENIRETPR